MEFVYERSGHCYSVKRWNNNGGQTWARGVLHPSENRLDRWERLDEHKLLIAFQTSVFRVQLIRTIDGSTVRRGSHWGGKRNTCLCWFSNTFKWECECDWYFASSIRGEMTEKLAYDDVRCARQLRQTHVLTMVAASVLYSVAVERSKKEHLRKQKNIFIGARICIRWCLAEFSVFDILV